MRVPTFILWKIGFYKTNLLGRTHVIYGELSIFRIFSIKR
ncbi:hypothetical protein LEP1GSC109_4403 [Leptospira interrogans str. UI 13372]|nr:hypothetical protein LEP1GSC109_4403 [Leptospira interrogans str. UI 13372]